MSCRKDPQNTIIIFQASYGRDSEVCPYKPGKPLPFKQIFEGEGGKDPLGFRCEEDVTKMIDKRCGWKKACDVAVKSSVSVRCGSGANQYLSVAYSCGKIPRVCLQPISGLIYPQQLFNHSSLRTCQMLIGLIFFPCVFVFYQGDPFSAVLCHRLTPALRQWRMNVNQMMLALTLRCVALMDAKESAPSLSHTRATLVTQVSVILP